MPAITLSHFSQLLLLYWRKRKNPTNLGLGNKNILALQINYLSVLGDNPFSCQMLRIVPHGNEMWMDREVK